MTVHFLDPQLAEMERRYLAGETLLDLAIDYGIAATGVRLRLVRRGVQIRPAGRRPTGRKRQRRHAAA